MCEFCNGNHLEYQSKTAGQEANSVSARTALSEEAGNLLLGEADKRVGKPTSAASSEVDAKDATSPASGVSPVDKPDSPTNTAVEAPVDPFKKYGVDVRIVDGQKEVFYKADQADHVVLRAPLTSSAEELSVQVGKVVDERISEIETKYHVDFAKEGEEVEKQITRDPKTCEPGRGEMIHARKPSLPALYGLEDGLKRTSPSQFTTDGKTGVKVYILDKGIAPNIYGNKPILGMYTDDKNKRPALYMTPAGMDLPPTIKDAAAAGKDPTRNISWVTIHETTHNSQRNNWPSKFVPADVSKELGWNAYDIDHEGKTLYQFFQFKGKDGSFYQHGASDCSSASTWYRATEDGGALDAHGKKVDKIADAQPFTNEQVIGNAQVKPFTYYFMNPREMLSEGLSAYRSGPEYRAKLAATSPQLYSSVAKYDQAEIDKFYGLTWSRSSAYVRSPEGEVVPNTWSQWWANRQFENSLQK